MPHIEKKKLFGGWATVHVVIVPCAPHTHYPPYALLLPVSEMKLAISKRPGAKIEMFSPTGREVGDNYFRVFPVVYFAPQEIIRVLCVLWRHSAVIRYSQLWQAFTIEEICACLARNNTFAEMDCTDHTWRGQERRSSPVFSDRRLVVPF